MKLTVLQRSGRTYGEVEVPNDGSVEDLKACFSRTYLINPNRIRFHRRETNMVLRQGLLSEYGLYDHHTVVFADLGPQISYKLVFVLEYLGPLVIPIFFYLFPRLFYSVPPTPKSTVQNWALFMSVFHFLKREIETLFVHKFSHATMPLKRLPINCFHYWVIYGVGSGYFVFHPQHYPIWASGPHIYVFVALFVIFELCNASCHVILSKLRKPGSTERGIPHGMGFDTISCANYLWESLSWLVYSVFVMTITTWIFFIVGTGQMLIWANAKHRAYKKLNNDEHKAKYAMIPFLR